MITSYGIPLTPIYSFKYLRRVLSEEYEDCPAVVCNLRQAKKKWACLARLLGREGADYRTPGLFYIAAVHAVLLYGSDMWVMYP